MFFIAFIETYHVQYYFVLGEHKNKILINFSHDFKQWMVEEESNDNLSPL